MMWKEFAGLVTDAHRRQYQVQGYFVLEGVIPDEHLQLLREECSYFIGYKDGQMDAAGVSVEDITHKGKRYFISNVYRRSGRLWRFIYSPLMAEVCRATLGETVYLFHEQWVVKGAEQGMKFAWHQDSGYIKFHDPATGHTAYLTCWCTLDDVNEDNGTVYVLPHDRGGTRNRILDHRREEGSNDLVGYFGEDPGVPVAAPAGSVVCFSSYLFHRSGANRTDKMRRIYLPQYSSEVIVNSVTGRQWAMAVPFLKNGEMVYDPATDLRQ